jgi:pimeloyl-ACP methyl ester carboxylesterase
MSLQHVRRGTGEPLLLLHHLGGEWRLWDPVIPLLSDKRDVIALDLPGFGASPPLPAGEIPSPRTLAVAVAALLDELDLETAHVAGFSLGAWVALELGVIGRARSVTAISTPRIGPTRPPPRRPPGLVLPFVGVIMRSSAMRRAILGNLMAYPERLPSAAAARMGRSFILAPAFDAVMQEMDSTRFTAWACVDIRVTLGWGELDGQLTPIEPPRPGIRSVVLADCGHISTWDNPAEVARVILEGSAS